MTTWEKEGQRDTPPHPTPAPPICSEQVFVQAVLGGRGSSGCSSVRPLPPAQIKCEAFIIQGGLI